jgi:hypothetical protein
VDAELLLLPDGRVVGVYTDAIDLRALGPVHVERATTVEWAPGSQEWVATLLSTGEVIARTTSREEAVRREVTVLQQRLLDNLPVTHYNNLEQIAADESA